MSNVTDSHGAVTLKAAPNLGALLGGGYTPFPRKVRQARLRASTKVIYNSLCSFFQMSELRGEECVWPTQAELSLDTTESLATVGRAIDELKACRMVVKKRRGRGLPDVYWLTDPQEWVLPSADGQPRNVNLTDQETSNCEIKNRQNDGSGSVNLIDLDLSNCEDQNRQNDESLYKKQQKKNNEPSNNKEQQQTNPTTRTAGAAAGGEEQTPIAQDEASDPARRGRQSSRRKKKEDQLELRVPLTHLEEESDEDWAAREFLSRVRRFRDCGMSTFERWTADLAPLVKTAGRDGFARWVTWLASDPWLKENGYKMRFAKWEEEFETWWNKPEPRPLRRGGMAPAAQRDERKIDNRIRDVEVLTGCLACGADVGTLHYEGCELLVLGKTVTRENEDRALMMAKLQERRRSAS